jgi:hypothetical protein
MRFYEATGGFLVEGLEVVFPPTGNEPATFLITKPSGEAVVNVPLRLERLENFPAFALFRPEAGNPGSVRVAQSGDFVMAVKIGNETITKLPFSLKEQVSSDPFNPGKTFIRDGPMARPGLSFQCYRRSRRSFAVQLVDEHARTTGRNETASGHGPCAC